MPPKAEPGDNRDKTQEPSREEINLGPKLEINRYPRQTPVELIQ